MSNLQLWRISTNQNFKLDTDVSTLDAVTRQLPDGYYSTFRTFERCTRVLGLTAHLRRLYEPVSTPEVDEPVLRRELRTLLKPYRPGEARVRVVMTKQGHVYLAMAPLPLLPRETYESGVRTETTDLQRLHPRLKSTAFIDQSDAERKHIAQGGIFEALLVKDGNILEGMTSNFFYIVEREAIPPYIGTARDDILLGITRATILEIARGMRLEVRYEPLKWNQLESVDEAFITSSSRGVVPVIQIDHVTVGEGNPGPITRRLAAAYEAYVIANAEKIL